MATVNILFASFFTDFLKIYENSLQINVNQMPFSRKSNIRLHLEC